MSAIKTKEQLLATLRDERSRWEALLDEVGEGRMTASGVADDWSVKDVLGHLAAYQRHWGARVRGEVTGVPPTPRDLFDIDSLPENAGAWTIGEQNAAIHARYAPSRCRSSSPSGARHPICCWKEWRPCPTKTSPHPIDSRGQATSRWQRRWQETRTGTHGSTPPASAPGSTTSVRTPNA